MRAIENALDDFDGLTLWGTNQYKVEKMIDLFHGICEFPG